jgi:predicted dienelactone hydrolase
MSQIDSLIKLLFDGEEIEEISRECDEMNQVENLFFAAATSRSCKVHKPVNFTSTATTNIESNFQAVLKRQLQTQVESHPPVFPWETEVADYPDDEDTTPSLKLVCSGSMIEPSIETVSLAPQKSLGQWLLAVNQTLAVKLVQTVESLFLKKAQNLKGLADSVTKNLHWSASLGKYLLLLLLWIMLPTLRLSNSSSAERIYLSYSNGELSISLEDLEEFAQTNLNSLDWRFLRSYLPANQLQELQRILVSPIKMHPQAMADFLYSQQGELVLERLAEVIKTESSQAKAEYYPLRTALILASQQPEGLTLLNVLRRYPSSNVRIDLVGTLRMSAQIKKLVDETNYALGTVTQKSDIQAATIQQQINFSQLPDFRNLGKLKVQKQTLKFHDLSRSRWLPTDVYLPTVTTVRNKIPIIVISHGLGTNSNNFAYLANHLASYGFAVLVPNHAQGNSLDKGIVDYIQPEEFYNRPLDIKYLLDELEKSHSRFHRLNFQQVGVIGQSFGGYTALALAGAQLNFEQIEKSCDKQTLKKTWNMSLPLQCRLQTWHIRNPDKKFNFQDPRIKAIIAVNPITSIVFGKAGLARVKVPVMMLASSDDTVTPALYEQILPFDWILNTQKYLVVLFGGTHFSVIGDSQDANSMESPSKLIGDNPNQARSYMKILTVPFFQTYIVGMKQKRYLNALFIKAISNPAMRLRLIQIN